MGCLERLTFNASNNGTALAALARCKERFEVNQPQDSGRRVDYPMDFYNQARRTARSTASPTNEFEALHTIQTQFPMRVVRQMGARLLRGGKGIRTSDPLHAMRP